MATATKKVHGARPVSEAASLAFRTYQDNGGNYHWEIAGRSGEILAHSGSFTSQDDAERAARKVHEGVRSARFEPHVAIERQTVAV
jgi:uncharacterized protein YegP (UPF0339 family)